MLIFFLKLADDALELAAEPPEVLDLLGPYAFDLLGLLRNELPLVFDFINSYSCIF